MVTTVTNDKCYEFRGLSTDTKPTNCSNGSIFLEMDTGNVYVFNAATTPGTWIKLS